jgi:hypothetical protein
MIKSVVEYRMNGNKELIEKRFLYMYFSIIEYYIKYEIFRYQSGESNAIVRIFYKFNLEALHMKDL